jgi:hypothetical protein
MWLCHLYHPVIFSYAFTFIHVPYSTMASKSSDHLDNKLPCVCQIVNDMEDYSSSPTKEEMMESQLKQMEQKGNMGCETTLSYVVSFNNTLLCTKCIKFSPQYDSEMNLNVLVQEISTPNQWWASRSVLFEAVDTFSLLLSFRPITSTYYLL